LRHRAAIAALALLALLAALPAAAYLLPAGAVLRRAAHKRESVALHALEVRGRLVLSGEAARQAAAATGLPLEGSELAATALVALKLPGRCRIELLRPEAAQGDRPAVSLRAGKLTGHGGLERVPAATAMLEGLCLLLGHRGGGGASERPWGQALDRLGVSLADVSLGRLAGRPAYVLGGRPQDPRPQAWFDKETYQPVRLLGRIAGAQRDVRLLEWGSPSTGDGFPRAVEVHEGGVLTARFTAEKLSSNPKIPDAIF